MKVKELIEALKKVNPELEVLTDGCERITSVFHFDFDGTSLSDKAEKLFLTEENKLLAVALETEAIR